MNAGYEVGSSLTVRALHQMPMPGPEGELHGHDYRFDVVVARGQLDEHGMVCDLDVLRAKIGYTLFQGYFFQRPEIITFLER